MNAPLAPCHFPEQERTGPRFREAGDVTLDHCHRDARVDDHWLGLSPREFALVWRLAEHPGERLCAAQLRADAWRIAFEPEGDGVAAHMARVRAKLETAGLTELIGHDADGCYFIDLPLTAGLLAKVPR